MDDEKKAFLEFERTAYAAGADAYTDWAETKTTQVIPHLLDAANVEPGQIVLDLACGPGFATAAIAERNATAIGLDISPEMITIARTRHPDIDFRVAEAEALPIETGTADAVISAFGLPTSPTTPPFSTSAGESSSPVDGSPCPPTHHQIAAR